MSTITITQLPNSGALTGSEVLPIVQGDVTVQTTVQDVANLGGGLSGTNFIYVAADGTDTANATALSAAYTTAKTMSPSATNRITIVAAPGYYNFGSTTFELDTAYIDLVSLDGNRSVIFNSANAGGTISITANDVFVKGVDVGTKAFTIGNNLSLLKLENCKGGNNSFGFNVIVSGIFTSCIGGIDSFGGGFGATASGTFTNCIGGEYSFANGGTASGTFTNCIGGRFGGVGIASGTFINCVGGDSSFGGYGIASGIFTNCQGGETSFGGQGTATGIFTSCVGGEYSFGYYGTASGTFTLCVGGNNSFGSEGTASGIFTNCQGGETSFGGGFGATASGIFTSCEGGNNSFGGNGATASGTFTSCVGGEYSFGVFGTLDGKLYYCRLTSDLFETVSGAGATYYCIDGNGDPNNQGFTPQNLL
jgi:hypothetical protein